MSSHPDMAKRLDQRYGAQPKPHDLRWNDTIDTLLAHRSVRAYLPDALPDGTVETLVAAAQSASTSSNLHQWSVVSVTDRELRKRIAAASRTGLEDNLYVEQAPVFLLWVADLSRNHALALDAGAEPVVHTYLDAFVMATIDAALAAQNAVIAAESLGLGICYIGAMRNNARVIAELIGLPAHSYVTFGLVVGIPDPAVVTSVRPRPVQDVILHENRYDIARGLAQLEHYEPAFEAFRSEQRMKPKTWKDAALAAATSTAYMGGREHLRAMVEDAGMGLR